MFLTLLVLYTFLPWHWQFFHTDTVASVHPLLVSWYLISSVWVYRCSCKQIMSILCSKADAVCSGRWPIIFWVLTLKVAICIVCLHFSSFCLSSVADFLNTEDRAPTSTGSTPFLPARRAMRFMYVVWVCHGYLSIAVFILIHRSHSYRWEAVVPRSNWQSWALSRKTQTFNTSFGIALSGQRVYSHTFTSIMLLPMCTCKK